MTIPGLLGNTGKNLKEKFFVGTNPTFGTAVAINTDPATIAATESTFCIYNNDSADGGRVIVVPSYLKLTTGVVAASGTSFLIRWAVSNTIRYASGGSELAGKSTFISQRSAYTTLAPKAKAYFGDLTTTAESGTKVVGQSIFSLQTASQLVGNTYLMQWDGSGGAMASTRMQSVDGTAQEGCFTDVLSPVYIEPQCSLVAQVIEASAATTAATFHVELGWYELDNWVPFS